MRASVVLVFVALPLAAHAGEPMTFFVTSVGTGPAGGNYGGLIGADARCQSLAQTVGAGDRIWRAYLSTSVHVGLPGSVQVDARDRIGSGPWHNFFGTEVAASNAALHANGIPVALMRDEYGNAVPDQGMASEHDIFTGSLADGTAKLDFPGNPTAPPPNCFNWTSNATDAYGWVGHTNASDIFGQSWSSQHEAFCDEIGLRSSAGSGRLYCFGSLDVGLIFADGYE